MTKRTRHLWGASYLFSYLMREIIKEVRKSKDTTILVPFVNEENLTAKNGAGLFPDRLLLESKSMSATDLKKIVDAICSKIALEGGLTDASILQNYLHTFLFECEEGGENPILQLQKHLDAMEQMPMYQANNNFDLIFFLDKINGAVFYAAAGRPKEGFPSIADIATKDLANEEAYKIIKNEFKNDDEQLFMKKLSTDKILKEKLLNYHHYIAIVQADGDNIGKTIAAIGTDSEKMNAFSKDLFDFSKEALGKIKDYGGEAVFAGGDDLLFFAPLANATKNDCSTILQLIHQIDGVFKAKLTNNSAYHVGNVKPTLSFGVSVTYYKFPLGESRETAGNALFKKAKDGDKNALALDLQKHSHSGAEIDLFYRKENEAFNSLIVNELVKLRTEKEVAPMLHSVAQIFTSQKAILQDIAKSTEHQANRLEYFFKNNFNESVHKPYHEGGFFSTLQTAMLLAIKDYGAEKGLKTIEQLIDIQHFIHRKTKD